ncbi:S-adenosyl-L-methionine-dependent methyltransferase [Hesseltinella vesiculosa]|uniref:S-adenosyl-L-methionine-dependent methyltransferase n=1 Tax=Hesseltinella vesiculosa TaxID=101127 RepID=A0A1X2GS37_9FUNG|nr:S-adenosyl-L-methionine-dependent methyltransferase [Hesseltinella vesiculosa]
MDPFTSSSKLSQQNPSVLPISNERPCQPLESIKLTLPLSPISSDDEDTICLSPPKKTTFKKRIEASFRKVLRRSSKSSAATSPTTAQHDGVTIGNRQYQDVNDIYFLPNDNKEMDRLLNNHFLVKFCFSSNYSSPVSHLLLKRPSARLDSTTTATAAQGIAEELRAKTSDDDLPDSPVYRPPKPSFRPHKRRSVSLDIPRNTDARTLSHRRNSSTASAKSFDEALIDRPRTLDIACGNGVWVLEMAHEFPDADFYGFDLCCSYPMSIRPANTFFCEHDVTKTFPYPDDYFEYVHFHDAGHSFRKDQTNFILQEIFRVMKPGGYVEIRELDPHIYNAGPATTSLTGPESEPMKALRHKYNVLPFWPINIQEELLKLNLVDIRTNVINMPCHCPEDDRLNKLLHQFWNDRLIAFERFYLETMENMTEKSLHALFKQSMHELEQYGSLGQYHMIGARKPLFPCALVPACLASSVSTLNTLFYADVDRSLNANSPTLPAIKTTPAVSLDPSPVDSLAASPLDGNVIYDFTDGFIE